MLYNKRHKLLRYLLVFFMVISAFLGQEQLANADGFATEFPYVVTVYNEKNGLPTGEANTVLQTKDGHIWIGSYGGLIRYDGSDFRNFSMEKAIPSDSIRSLYEDSQGRLWIGTNDVGVIMMCDDVFTQIESPSDKSFLCIRDFVETEDGSIYVASPSGLAQIIDGKIAPIEDELINNKGVFSIAVDKYHRVWGAQIPANALS